VMVTSLSICSQTLRCICSVPNRTAAVSIMDGVRIVWDLVRVLAEASITLIG
jgi:hypothetical protein